MFVVDFENRCRKSSESMPVYKPKALNRLQISLCMHNYFVIFITLELKYCIIYNLIYNDLCRFFSIIECFIGVKKSERSSMFSIFEYVLIMYEQ